MKNFWIIHVALCLVIIAMTLVVYISYRQTDVKAPAVMEQKK